MRNALVLASTLFVATLLSAADVPGAKWEMHSRAGWSEAQLIAVRDFAATKQTAAVIIVQGGKVVDQWGGVDKKWDVQSIRKSFLNALYGVHVAEGRINLGKTLGDLGIDDNPPALTPVEKQASILDLMRSRSGVYRQVSRETPAARASRPPRGSQAPGAFYYYNNWDFDVLGVIFQKETGTNLFAEFAARIARPIGMEDYVPADGLFTGGGAAAGSDDTMHPRYAFAMTARDMARFGLLYLRNGRWVDKQIVPVQWVMRSTTSYTAMPEPRAAGGAVGFGLMWYQEEWGYSARGNGGHVIAVVPSKDLVIVHRVVRELDGPLSDRVSYQDVFNMVRMVMDAAPAPSALRP